MLKSGQPVNASWTTINLHGARADFHNGEIISTRDAMESRRARMLMGGSGGMQLASPMEYDMTQAYGGQTWVHVGADNDAATAGTIDPVSGLAVVSAPGWYCSCAAGVPIAGTEESPAYNIPQVPLPDPDDIDDPNNFGVIYIAEAQCY